MPSAYHRSLMHEKDGDGQCPVPLGKRSQPVETAEERQHELKVQENAKDRSKISRREGGRVDWIDGARMQSHVHGCMTNAHMI